MTELQKWKRAAAIATAITLANLNLSFAAMMSPMVMPASVPSPSQVFGLGAQTAPGVGLTLISWQSTRDTLRVGTTDVDNPDQNKSVDWRYTMLVDYNVFKNLTAIVSVPYVHNHATETGGFDQTTSGVGDLGVFAKYSFFRDQLFNAHEEIQGLVGLEFPTGSSTSKDSAGQTAETSDKVGSGSYNEIIGLYGMKGFGPCSIYGNITYKNYGQTSYRFGNVFNGSVGVNFPLPPKKSLSLTAEWITQVAAHDRTNADLMGRLPDGRVVNTGGTTHYLAPGLQWHPSVDFSLSFSAQIPIYQNLNGTIDPPDNGLAQLKTNVNYVTAISTRFGAKTP